MVEELTDAENLIRFSSFQRWLDGTEPFMVEGRIERSLALTDVMPDAVAVERTVTGTSCVAAIGRSSGLTVGMEVGIRYTEYRVSAARQDQADHVAAEIERRASRAVEANAVSVRVWTSHHGGSYNDRDIEVPHWDEVARNYPSRVRSQLSELIAMPQLAADSSRLIL